MLTQLPWLGPLIVFGLVVFVHELGHFIAAKTFRVYAPRFSIGFGPALFRKRWGETEYVLASLPLGGYVRMASREDETAAALEGGNESESLSPDDPRYDPAALMPFGPHPVPADRTFESKPLWQRLIIMVAGVTMNVILALVIMTGLAKASGRSTLQTRVVGRFDPPAWAIREPVSIARGDTILAVGSKEVANWNELEMALFSAPDTVVTIRTQRGSSTLAAGPAKSERRAQLVSGIIPWYPPVVGSVIPNRPAARAGIEKGDTLVRIDTLPIATYGDMMGIVSASPGRPLEIELRRGGATRTVKVVPDSERLSPRDSAPRFAGRIGVSNPDVAVHEPMALGEAARAGWAMTWGSVGMIVDFLGNLLTGQASVRDMGGPIAITQASVAAAKNGMSEFLRLLAFISINLAVMNLLPIPILDGGQIVMNVAESVKGRPFSLRTRENFARVGLLAIALLFVVVMFNDLRRIAGTAMDYLSRVF